MLVYQRVNALWTTRFFNSRCCGLTVGLVQAQRAVADIATFLKEKGINTCLGKKWGTHGEHIWTWHHKAIKSWVFVRGTWISSGGNGNHDFFGIRWCSSKQLPLVLETFSPIIMVQWKIGTRNKRKRSYWRYCTPIFHWTMIMGGRVVTHVESSHLD